MHMGQVVQSHGMHFFELGGPDLLLGFDADPAIRNVVGLLAADPGLTVKAVQSAQMGAGNHSHLSWQAHSPEFCHSWRREQSSYQG